MFCTNSRHRSKIYINQHVPAPFLLCRDQAEGFLIQQHRTLNWSIVVLCTPSMINVSTLCCAPQQSNTLNNRHKLDITEIRRKTVEIIGDGDNIKQPFQSRKSWHLKFWLQILHCSISNELWWRAWLSWIWELSLVDLSHLARIYLMLTLFCYVRLQFKNQNS